ncbi:MAG: N(4)-(beta-N-acetylglucosaminyl)-L-asparaginase [Verrucomicrobia bacterium]|nr:MAG: N(4)-(beta-N-acetylglucosaminyl)-L-asparaginase [Verrucomicrobiota bacterium]
MTSEAKEKSMLNKTSPVIVSTWPFGKASNDEALRILQQGGSGLDAVEKGIWVTENDLSNSSVGAGGMPNAMGVVQLDSCIMSGPGHKAGSVAAIEGIRHPISAARRVMEKTRHVMLVGAGAREFALKEGLEVAEMPTEGRRREWLQWKAEQEKSAAKNHDTIALILLAPDGHLYGGCSTSGWAYKLPGRVGDSPIIGGGLYVDDEVGAAGATGIGENVMRYCGSFQVVSFMQRGATPTEACLETVKAIARKDPKGADLSINFIAVDKKGRYGAAGSAQGFSYSVTTPKFSQVETGRAISTKELGPVGGNRP